MYVFNDEINKLYDEIEPWMDGAVLDPNAPQEVVDKHEKIKKLVAEEEKKRIDEYFV